MDPSDGRSLVPATALSLIVVSVIALLVYTLPEPADAINDEDLSDQLELFLPNPILEERVGAIDTMVSDGNTYMAWLAHNPAISRVPPGGRMGNLIYISSENKSTGEWVTKRVDVDSYNVKSDIRIAPDDGGLIHILWLEDGALWECRLDNGVIVDERRLLPGPVAEFEVVSKGSGVLVFWVDSVSDTVHRMDTGSKPPTDRTVFADDEVKDLHGLSTSDLSGMDLVLFIGTDVINDEQVLPYILLDGVTQITNGNLSGLSFDPSETFLIRRGDEALAVLLNSTVGNVSLLNLTVVDQSVEARGSMVSGSLEHPISRPHAIIREGSLDIYSLGQSQFLGGKVQAQSMNLSSGVTDEVSNVCASDLSMVEDTFDVLVDRERVLIAIGEIYRKAGGMSADFYSKLVLYTDATNQYTPISILNVRSSNPSNIDGFTTLVADDGRCWVVASHNSNGSLETILLMADPQPTGRLEWVDSTPWHSSFSFTDAVLKESSGHLDLICKRFFDFDESPVPMVGFEYNLSNGGFSQPSSYDVDVMNRRTYRTWNCAIRPPGTVVFSTLESRDEMSFMEYGPGEEVGQHLGTLSSQMDYRDHHFMFQGGDAFLFSLERNSTQTKSLVRKLDISGGVVTVDRSWTVFVGDYYEHESIRVRRTGPSDVSIIATSTKDGVGTNTIYVFDLDAEVLDPGIEIESAKDYLFYDVDIAEMDQDRLIVATWGLDFEVRLEEDRYLMDLGLMIIDRDDMGKQEPVSLLTVTSALRDITIPPPVLSVLPMGASRSVVVFQLNRVESGTISIYSVLFDPGSPSLSPIRPVDGSILNTTSVEFETSAVGDAWESSTYYSIQVFKEDDGDTPFITSPWRPYPSDELVIPEGDYLWTVVYRRFHVVVAADWYLNLTIDTTLPTPDAGGPYLDAVVGVPITLDASSSRDNTGISLYRWIVYGNPQLKHEAADPTFEITPDAVGNIQVRLEAVDLAGNRAWTTTTVSVKPPLPGFEVDMPTQAFEGRDTSFTCTITNPYEGVTYSCIWDFGTSGRVGEEVVTMFEDDGDYPITIDVWDSFGQNAWWSGTISVENLPPVVDDIPDITIDETEDLVLVGRAHDVPSDALLYTWFIDGEQVATGRELSHSLEDGQYLLTLTVKDDLDAETSTSTDVTVIPVISDVFVQISYDPATKKVAIKWSHGHEPDFRNVTVSIFKDPEDTDEVWKHVFDDQDGNVLRLSSKELPSRFYVQVVLRDNSLTSSSDLLEFEIPTEPDVQGDGQWLPVVVMLVIIAVALAIAVIYLLRKG